MLTAARWSTEFDGCYALDPWIFPLTNDNNLSKEMIRPNPVPSLIVLSHNIINFAALEHKDTRKWFNTLLDSYSNKFEVIHIDKTNHYH